MEICFVTCDSVNTVWQEKLGSVAKSDLLVFGFNGLGLVSYKKELGGETEYFQDIARLSRQLSSVIICGCDTDTYGVFRHSAVIADKGKIVGVSDMVHAIDETEYAAGGSYKVYDTSAGKIGIIVSEDLYFFESTKVLASCDADVIVCLFKTLDGSMPQIMLRAAAFANGVVMALCAEKYAAVADIKGNIMASGGNGFLKCSVEPERDYHLVSSRRRGLFRENKGGYRF